MSDRLRVLELFCGIGGCAKALGGRAAIVAAVDINQRALGVYRANFAHPAYCRSIESLPGQWLQEREADLWWLSPPCQPFTRRGRRRDLADPRAASFLSLLEKIESIRPRYVAVENVAGFAESSARRRLRETLARGGYDVRETHICPTQLGAANRRPRYYLVAGRDRLAERSWTSPPVPLQPLPQILETVPASSSFWVNADLLQKYRQALHLVDESDTAAITSCFTSAYGRSLVRSGSYLRTAGGVRRFSPGEMLRLLGFMGSFCLPSQMSTRIAWRLAGNSLSIPAVQAVLSAIPALADGRTR